MPGVLVAVKKAIAALEKLFKAILFLLGVALIADVILQIIGRYFATPIFWTEEVSRFIFRYIVAFGAPLAVRSREYVFVDTLVGHLPPPLRKRLSLAVNLVLAAYMFLITYQAVSFVRIGWIMLSPVLQIPMSFGYAAVFCAPLFVGVMLLLSSVEEVLEEKAVEK